MLHQGVPQPRRREEVAEPSPKPMVLSPSAHRIQGLPLIDEAVSLTLSRVSIATDEYLASQRDLVSQGKILPDPYGGVRPNGGHPFGARAPNRPFIARQYAQRGIDRYSTHGSVGYSDRALDHDHAGGGMRTLTLDRAPCTYGNNSPFYTHVAHHDLIAADQKAKYGASSAAACGALLWRERVPFSCPIRHPELMSYDPLLINSRVLGLTRDVGIHNTASGLGGDAISRLRSFEHGDTFSLGVDRSLSGMSLRKHSLAHRMSHPRTYPGVGEGRNASSKAARDTETFLRPFIAGYDASASDDYGGASSTDISSNSETAKRRQRSAKLREMGISGFASSSSSSSFQRARSSPPSPASNSDYLTQRREDALRKSSASLVGAIGAAFGHLSTEERSKIANTTQRSPISPLHAMVKAEGSGWNGAGGKSAGLLSNDKFGFADRDGDWAFAPSVATPTRHLSADWHWRDVDPASSYLVQRSQQRHR